LNICPFQPQGLFLSALWIEGFIGFFVLWLLMDGFFGAWVTRIRPVLGGSLLSKKEPVGIRIRYMRTFGQWFSKITEPVLILNKSFLKIKQLGQRTYPKSSVLSWKPPVLWIFFSIKNLKLEVLLVLEIFKIPELEILQF